MSDEPTPPPSNGPGPEDEPELTLQPLVPPSPFPSIPDVLIFEEIGKGGMGRVFKGKQRFTDRPVAVKVLEALGTGDEFAQRFRREAKVMASMSHDHIVSCLTAGTNDDGQSYIVMELIDGPDLWRYVREHGPLEPANALRVARDVAQALAYAHQSGIIHRDIKAANVLLAPRRHAHPDDTFPYDVKLADLGLARPSGSPDGSSDEAMMVTQPGLVMGTPSCMAPEQFGDPANTDFRSDIYGLGCVLFQALTGEPPFGQGDLTTIFRVKMEPDPPDPTRIRPDLPEPIAGVVKRMLARDKDDRHASHDELIGELQLLMGDQQDTPLTMTALPAQDLPGSGAHPAQDQGDGRRALPVPLLLALVLVAAGAGWWFLLGPGSEDTAPDEQDLASLQEDGTGTGDQAAPPPPPPTLPAVRIQRSGLPGPVDEGAWVRLDAVLDPPESGLTYQWEVLAFSQIEPPVPAPTLAGEQTDSLQLKIPDLVVEGTVTVQLTVSKDDLEPVVAQESLVVHANNDPPVLSAPDLPASPAAGQRLEVDLAARASDPEGGPLSWALADLDGFGQRFPGALELEGLAESGRFAVTIPAGQGERWRLRASATDRLPGGLDGATSDVDLELVSPWPYPAPQGEVVVELLDGARTDQGLVAGSLVALRPTIPPATDGTAVELSWDPLPGNSRVVRNLNSQLLAAASGTLELDLPVDGREDYRHVLTWSARYPGGPVVEGQTTLQVDGSFNVSPVSRATVLVDNDSLAGVAWRWLRGDRDPSFEGADDGGVLARAVNTIKEDAFLLPRGRWVITGRLRLLTEPPKPVGEAGLWVGSQEQGAVVLDIHGNNRPLDLRALDQTVLELCLSATGPGQPLNGHDAEREGLGRTLACDTMGLPPFVHVTITWDGSALSVALDGNVVGSGPIPLDRRPRELGLFVDNALLQVADLMLTPLD